MARSFSGHQSLICPDCGMGLINHSPSQERYHCSDCDLRMTRDGEWFELVRFGEVVGKLMVDEVELQVTWRLHDLAHAV